MTNRAQESGPLREAVSGRAVPWARSHRLLVGGVAAALVVVAAGTAYVVTRPPAVDPVVRIGIVALNASNGGDIDPQGRPRGTWEYVLSTEVAGDVDTPVGIVGPGLVDPTSSITHVGVDHPGIGTLGATVECRDARWWAAKDTDYHARVRRTDTYGRVTTADIALGKPTDSFWHDHVRQFCLDPFVQTLPAATATGSTDAHPGRVDVTVAMTNPTEHGVWVAAAAYSDDVVTMGVVSTDPSSADSGPWTALPPGGTASLSLSVVAADCSRGAPRLPFTATSQGAAVTDRGLPFLAADNPAPAEDEVVGLWVRLDTASADRLGRQLAGAALPAHTMTGRPLSAARGRPRPAGASPGASRGTTPRTPPTR